MSLLTIKENIQPQTLERKPPTANVGFLEHKMIIECTKKKIPNPKFKPTPEKEQEVPESSLFFQLLFIMRPIRTSQRLKEKEFLSFGVRRC